MSNIETIANEFARLAPDFIEDHESYVGLEEDDQWYSVWEWYSVWALNDQGIGRRIISIMQDDIPALAERMAALPDGALNDERIHRGLALFDGLRVDFE